MYFECCFSQLLYVGLYINKNQVASTLLACGLSAYLAHSVGLWAISLPCFGSIVNQRSIVENIFVKPTIYRSGVSLSYQVCHYILFLATLDNIPRKNGIKIFKNSSASNAFWVTYGCLLHQTFN